MYIPKHFSFTDKDSLLSFIEQYSFGDLVTCVDGVLDINHLPFLVNKEQNCLLTHVAKQNPHWQLVEKVQDLKVVFHGPDAYISPNWYSHNKNVPTWNFLSVQVKGSASLLTQEQLVELLDQLSQKHEAQFTNPWKIDKMAPSQLEAMCRAIVGIKIEILDIQGKAKLSQNKPESEVQRLIDGLQQQQDEKSKQVSEWMKHMLQTREQK